MTPGIPNVYELTVWTKIGLTTPFFEFLDFKYEYPIGTNRRVECPVLYNMLSPTDFEPIELLSGTNGVDG